MKKVALFIITALIVLLFSSCGNGNENTPDNPPIQKPHIAHSFTITSSAPVTIQFTASVASKDIDIYFNGVNENKLSFTKDVPHEGTKTYTISAVDHLLTSYLYITSLDGKEVEVSYVWSLLSDNKVIKADKEVTEKGTIISTKIYSTTISDF